VDDGSLIVLQADPNPNRRFPMSRRIFTGFSLCVAAAVAAVLATHLAFAGGTGEPDSENRYPNVGAIVVTSGFPGVPFIEGSGVLIHPRVLICAGHSTALAERLLDQGIPLFDHFRISFGTDAFDPSTWREAVAVFTHPGYVGGPEMFNYFILPHDHDLGVVILKEPVDLPFATLPYEGLLDDLKDAGLLVNEGEHEKLIAVGYGPTIEFPPPEGVILDGLRRVSSPEYRALDNNWLHMNQNPAAGNSGIPVGDSGGPAFWSNLDGELIVVGITSRKNRLGNFLAYRLDLPEAREFIEFILALVDGGAF
jgi:hypothetical protein